MTKEDLKLMLKKLGQMRDAYFWHTNSFGKSILNDKEVELNSSFAKLADLFEKEYGEK